MRELSNEKLQSICNDYINGNFTDFKEAIKKLNKLQVLQLSSRCEHCGIGSHNMYTKLVRTLTE